jgi:hypothetical protein
MSNILKEIIMRKIFYHLRLPLITALLLAVSCEQQPTDEEFRESLSEIKQEMQYASELIYEAIEAEHSRELISKSDQALDVIENQLNAYMNEMDEAVRRIFKDTRTNIIDIKQKIAEIDFRLALLEGNEQLRMSEEAEGYDETYEYRRTRPVGYRFPQITRIDDTLIRDRVQYGREVMDEVITNLKELNDELNQFIEENL